MARIHHTKTHMGDFANKLNWLRASVLGANDGIISIAALLVGVAGASADSKILLVTGIAGLLAGAFSMAAGEYVSVSSQRDSEEVILAQEKYELEHDGVSELVEVAAMFDPNNLTNPWHASLASAISYTLGGIIPIIAVMVSEPSLRVPVTFVAVFVALCITGIISARVTGAGTMRTVLRVIIGGFIAMGITFGAGHFFNVSSGL